MRKVVVAAAAARAMPQRSRSSSSPSASVHVAASDQLLPELVRSAAPSVCPVSCFPSSRRFDEESDALLSPYHKHLDCKSAHELETTLLAVDVARLLDSVAKAQYFVQLCHDRFQLSALTVKCLARLICALESHASNQQVARFIQQCLCAKPAKACTALKMEVDQLLPLYDLVFCSIQNKSVRDEILSHFDAQAAKVKELGTLAAPLKLISDIDDTIFAAACDARFPNSTVYPGARQFVAEVARSISWQRTAASSSPTSEWDAFVSSVTPRQCFLTNRPEALKQQVGEALRRSGFSHVTVLAGNLMNVFGSKWVMSSKLERIKCLVRLFAEFQFVFVGDSGQSDVELAKALLSDPQSYPLAAILIHDVSMQNADSTTKSASDKSCSLAGDFEEIGVFKTYVTAAFQLYARGLLSVEAVGRIVRSTISDLSSTAFSSETQKRSMTKQAMSDISSVVDKLPTNQDAMVMLEGFHERRSSSAARHKLSGVSAIKSPVDHIA